MDVGELAFAELIDLSAIVFDPGKMAQFDLVFERNYRNFARTRPIRVRTDFENDLLACCFLKETVDVICAMELAATNGGATAPAATPA